MQVKGGEWGKVRNAIAKSDLLRTVEGISQETGLPEAEVEQLLKEHDAEVRKAHATDTGGRIQYTLRNRPMGAKELWATIRAVVTGQP